MGLQRNGGPGCGVEIFEALPLSEGSFHGIHGRRGYLRLAWKQDLVHLLLPFAAGGYGGLVPTRHLSDAVPLRSHVSLRSHLTGGFVRFLRPIEDATVAATADRRQSGLGAGHRHTMSPVAAAAVTAGGCGRGRGRGSGRSCQKGLESQEADGHAEGIHGVQARLFDRSAPLVKPWPAGFPFRRPVRLAAAANVTRFLPFAAGSPLL